MDWIYECPDCGVFVGCSRFIEGDYLGQSDGYHKNDLKIALNYGGMFLRERMNNSVIQLWRSNAKQISNDTIMVTDLCTQISDL